MTRLPPAEKLPLAVRKDLRDNWESKKEDYEKQLSDVLGEKWTFDIDPKNIYPYGEDRSYAKESTGAMISEYASSAVSGIKYYVEKYGDLAKAEINKAAPAHVITMDLDDNKKVSYCGVAITPTGQLAMIWKDGNLASNISYVTNEESLNRALNDDVADEGMAWQTRLNISENYTPNIAAVNKKLNEMLKKDYTFEPNFEANYAKLAAAKNADFKENLGYITHSYFDALVSHLAYKQFGTDEMLQEGLTEVADAGKVSFRVVDNGTTKKSYGDAIFDGGILYIQTTPEYYGSNTHQVAEKIEDEL